MMTKSVAGDRFGVRIQANDGRGAVNLGREDIGGGSVTAGYGASPSGSTAAFDEFSNVTVTLRLFRVAGTGTASAGELCVLHWIFIPAP